MITWTWIWSTTILLTELDDRFSSGWMGESPIQSDWPIQSDRTSWSLIESLSPESLCYRDDQPSVRVKSGGLEEFRRASAAPFRTPSWLCASPSLCRYYRFGMSYHNHFQIAVCVTVSWWFQFNIWSFWCRVHVEALKVSAHRVYILIKLNLILVVKHSVTLKSDLFYLIFWTTILTRRAHLPSSEPIGTTKILGNYNQVQIISHDIGVDALIQARVCESACMSFGAQFWACLLSN